MSKILSKVLIIDNYDSFTFNLSQYCEELGAKVIVKKNNEITIAEIKKIAPTHIIISPGPGTPENPGDIGICEEVIKKFIQFTPILGVCLGHQAIAHFFGAKIVSAPEIMHGKTSKIIMKKISKKRGEKSNTNGIFKNIPKRFTAMRYHSLIVDEKSFPHEHLRIIARTKENNLIMGFEHKKYSTYGIQFHPESFATPHGKKIIENFLNLK